MVPHMLKTKEWLGRYQMPSQARLEPCDAFIRITHKQTSNQNCLQLRET